ncbi:hypothetical protein ABRP32_05840 [Providencia manganoxydans]|uniref:hypothetical protein n=1 Tax=Providencia manganoxydans TaxID=2923283 RepID=UPI003AF3EED7
MLEGMVLMIQREMFHTGYLMTTLLTKQLMHGKGLKSWVLGLKFKETNGFMKYHHLMRVGKAEILRYQDTVRL